MVCRDLKRWCWMLALALLGTASPGSVVQDLPLRMTGAASGTWHVTASRIAMYSSPERTDYQWYLSVYAPNGALAYRSPGDSPAVLARLQKAHGAPNYFPYQTLTIAGTGRLMGSDEEQAVVAVHEIGADCGLTTVAVIGSASVGQRAAPVARVTNFCDLQPKIAGDAVQLTGPYYGPGAPLCCPTKNHVTATLRYRDGRWVETPSYFRLLP